MMDEQEPKPTGSKPTNRAKQGFWQEELKSSAKMLEDWHKQATKIVRRFTDDRNRGLGDLATGTSKFRLNLFHTNITTLQSMLYGSLPTIDVTRRNADPNDDMARVAAEIMERLLNLDVETNGSEYDAVLRGTLQDRLLPGLGVARLRYEFDSEERERPAEYDGAGFMTSPAMTEQITTNERAPVEYYHWQDVLWGWARSFADVPWIAFK